MSALFHPDFCTLLPSHWPAPLHLPGAQLVLAQFDATRLQADDCARCAVPPVPGVSKRQSEYLAGRLCARQALHLLTHAPQIPGRDEDGVPLWPAGVCGSISHGAGFAAALVGHSSQWAGLGLDLEKRLKVERAAKLAGEILTTAELQRSAGLDPEAFAQRVTLTFSLKESLFKALYPLVRQRFYFHDAELLQAGDGRARLRLLIDLGQGWHSGCELDGQYTDLDQHLLSLIAIAA